ncbi:MAG: Ig-like domain-containing protein, partial [Candidatus Methylomirabilales bacterium]
HLYVAERSRLFRFRAPNPPHLSPGPPAYTNQATLQLAGTASPGALITARSGGETATTQAEPERGTFFLSPIRLQANRENRLEAFATGVAGHGLTSAPAAFRILHDDVEPTVSTRTDPAGPYLRGQVHLIAEAQDPAPDGGAASGLARLTLRLLDAGPTEVIRTAAEGAGTADPLMALQALQSPGLPDGPYTLEATAEDYAGNHAIVSQPRTLDNTPPSLGILGVSSGATVRGTLQVEVVSADATSGLDRVELSLDGRTTHSSGEAPLRAAFDTGLLASGLHTLLAQATDRAGNEATTIVPFTVANLTVHLVSPASGTSVPSGTVLVQGTVETSAAEVGVVINDILAAVQGTTFAALVTVTPETTSLTARATTATGATASHSLVIT